LNVASDDGSGKKSGTLSDLVTAESMIQLALAVPGGCVIGWFIGDALDRHFHTGWIQIAGIVVGAVGGFLQIFRTVSRYLKRSGS
jgi:F0F1-type ATP synthase assembly protein I